MYVFQITLVRSISKVIIQKSLYCICTWITKVVTLAATRGCIFGRNWDKNLETFVPCYSQSLPPANFTPLPPWFSKIFTAPAERRCGLGFVCIISLFIFEISIVLSLITLYFLQINTSFSHRDINQRRIKRRDIKQKTKQPLWFQKSLQNNQPMNETQVCS